MYLGKYVMSFSSMSNLLDRHNGKYMRKSFPDELCWISKRNFIAVELIWEGNTVCSRSKDDGFLPKKVSKQASTSSTWLYGDETKWVENIFEVAIHFVHLRFYIMYFFIHSLGTEFVVPFSSRSLDLKSSWKCNQMTPKR